MSHIARAVEINKITFKQKVAKIYRYAPDLIFDEQEETISDIASFNAVFGSARAQPPVPMNAAAIMCVGYFKGRFNTTAIYSVHRDLWAAGTSGPSAAFHQLSTDDVMASMQDTSTCWIK